MHPATPSSDSNAASFNVKLCHALLQIVQHQGISISDALVNSIIEQSTLDAPGQRYQVAVFAQLLAQLIQRTNTPKLPLLAAEAPQPRMLGCLGFVMTTANTLQDAYQMLSDYIALVHDGVQLHIEHHQQHCTLTLQLEGNDPAVTEYFMGCLLNWPRWLTGRQVPAQSISFIFPQHQGQDYHQQLATAVSFSQTHNQVVFSNQYMALACSEANWEMQQLHCNFADQLLLRSMQQQALISQTKHQIRKLIQQTPTADSQTIRRQQVATCLNLSLRTFQRRLKLLDSNFQKIYDSVRHEVCLQLIADQELNFAQISYKLGFSNPSALQKAFKRWMKTSPSEYRSRLLSSALSEQPNKLKTTPKPIWFLQLSDLQIHSQVEDKLVNISSFSLQLLRLAATIKASNKAAVPMAMLADISGNSLARLSIYLWPAQEQQLIDRLDSANTDNLALSFCHDAVVAALTDNTSAEQCSEQHLHIGHYYQRAQQPQQALLHFQLCDLALLTTANLKSFNQCCRALIDASNPGQQQLLLDIYQCLIDCREQLGDHLEQLPCLYLEQLEISIEATNLALAERRVADLQQAQLSLQQQVSLAVHHSHLLLAKNNHQQALALLINTATQKCQIAAFPNSDSDLLVEVATQLDRLANLSQSQLKEFSLAKSTDKLSAPIARQLRILQQIIEISLQHQRPLLAVGAISRMFELSLTAGDYFYSSFSSAHFAWVCSWFAGNIKMAKLCRDRALHLAKAQGDSHSRQCQLILYSKVYHWLGPMTQALDELHTDRDSNDGIANSNDIQSCLLVQYLLLCSGQPLETIKLNCEQLLARCHTDPELPSNTALRAIINICSSLLQPSTGISQPPLTYHNCSVGFADLFSAFYSFKHSDWPQLQSWDAKIETDIPSHYIVTEAVFICTLMRIYCLPKQSLDPLQLSQLEGYLTRLQIWAKLCPINFDPQYQIAKAVYYAQVKPLTQAITQFETALLSVEKQGHLQHKIICYRYYAQLLKGHYIRLSALCSEKQLDLERRWLSLDNLKAAKQV
ncbi:MAG: hypothetical protein OFPI_34950 [Osedax symbiont Rs2]|nr:MAG: hypothetical protein OFPI_34950 [Osedax symbiont Rs2]